MIQGSKNSYIVLLVERHSRFVILAKISDNKTTRKAGGFMFKTLTRLKLTEAIMNATNLVESNKVCQRSEGSITHYPYFTY
ncbi:hypothetical protein XNW1_2630001 [Xenorhabdus nematophila str. Websteri]|nr:hypothetical protein XNA1_4410001 [Xenorhabdus nematophila str. Anatoliense]CEF30522.1 hypothetical protein XNW1_2630001 [Xenorhabdus nematophila str. Websteri]